MKRYLKVLALIAALAVVFCACGGGASSGERTDMAAPSANTCAPDSYSGFADRDLSLSNKGYEAESQSSGSTKNADGSTSLPAIHDNTKVIFTARMGLQSTEFEKTQALIERMVNECGGYLENVEVYNGSSIYKSSVYRSAEFTVRVPQSSFNSFLSGINENCHVVSLSQSAQDVGEQYFDTEQRLETLNNKHDRLETLLQQASTMNDIIQLENALSDCEYEINRLQTTLNRYDSLISFSTVSISLQEVERPDSGIDETPGFFERLGRSFSEGFERFTEGAEDLALWLSGHILTLVILVIIIIALIKIKPIRRIRKKTAPQERAGAAEK